jgi:hypothetical protein
VLLHAVAGLDTAAVGTVLSGLLASPNVAFRSVGLAALLQRGDPTAISNLQQLWPGVKGDKSHSNVTAALRDFYRPATPQLVQQLADMAAANWASGELRTASVTALAAVHSPESLSFLGDPPYKHGHGRAHERSLWNLVFRQRMPFPNAR